ncbi:MULTISPECIES: hypothetical protein [Acetobacter]|uniref:hypothetical protein n=1 Tax=Acetobacter TaxID=434 RepID=UPI00119D155B|nr:MULTISPECIES: hypothetical protein [Acetobacter]
MSVPTLRGISQEKRKNAVNFRLPLIPFCHAVKRYNTKTPFTTANMQVSAEELLIPPAQMGICTRTHSPVGIGTALFEQKDSS